MTDTTLPLDGVAIDHDAPQAATSWSAKTWLAMLATSFALVSAEFLPAAC